MAKDEALKTGYLNKDIIKMILVTSIRLLNMKNEELP